MAEGTDTAERSYHRFFCHVCSVEVTPDLSFGLPAEAVSSLVVDDFIKVNNFTCPRCHGGFIEELETPLDDLPDNDIDPGGQFAELLLHGAGLLRNPPTVDGPSDDADDVGSVSVGLPPTIFHSHRPTLLTIQRRNHNSEGQVLHGFLENLLGGLTGGAIHIVGPSTGGSGLLGSPFGTILNIHGNPGDYAWGTGGLDNIITQLLNQLEGSGPPPADERQIQALPKVKVTQTEVDHNVQCSVCMEDLVLNEDVRQLPCNHLYHHDCIVPWLELHGTCPVCRTTLDGRRPQQETPDSDQQHAQQDEELTTRQASRDSTSRSQSNENQNSRSQTTGHSSQTPPPSLHPKQYMDDDFD